MSDFGCTLPVSSIHPVSPKTRRGTQVVSENLVSHGVSHVSAALFELPTVFSLAEMVIKIYRSSFVCS